MPGAGRRRRRRPSEPHEAPGPEAALEIAFRFLATRPRTRWELERRLQRAGADAAAIAATMERLATLGHVDDDAFVRWWAEQRDRHSPRGRRMLEAELRQRGVPREVIEAHRLGAAPTASLEAADAPPTEEDRARAALERHLRGRPLPTEGKALQRVGMFLVRRGFDPDSVRAALRQAGDAGDDVADA